MIDNPVLMIILIVGLIIAFVWIVRNYSPKKVVVQKRPEIRPYKDRCPLGKYLEGLTGEPIVVVDFTHVGNPIVQRASDRKKEKIGDGEQSCFVLWRAEECKVVKGATYEIYKRGPKYKTSLRLISLPESIFA